MFKKEYYYVLVFTTNGPRYVTLVDDIDNSAFWADKEKPFPLSKKKAYHVAEGLMWNGFSAVVVSTKYSLEYQPMK